MATDPAVQAYLEAQAKDASIRANNPAMAWMLSIPELARLLESLVGPTGVTVDQQTLENKLKATQWWQQTSDTARNFDQLMGEDPATAKQQIAKSTDAIRSKLGLLGLNDMDPTVVAYLGVLDTRLGWSETQLDQVLERAAFQFFNQRGLMGNSQQAWGGEIGAGMTRINQLASDYLVKIDPITSRDWATAIALGQMTQEGAQGYIQQKARENLPTMIPYMDQGMTPGQVIEPMRQKAAQLLEVSTDQIDPINSPVWKQMIDYADPKTGVHRVMTETEAENLARQQPQWANTANAKQSGATMAMKLLADMGAAKF